MGYFYFDESIHSLAHFVLGAFAYSETALENYVAEALQQSGLRPGIDEFKSGSRMDQNPLQANTRRLLKRVVQDHCRIGIVVAPEASRSMLGDEALLGLSKILTTNRFKSGSHDVFFDEGIFTNSATGQLVASQLCPGQDCRFHFEQNSILVMGLQVADLIAHTCATMLLAQLGLIKKMVKAGDDSGYDPEMDVELEFELWAGLRYNFFADRPL